MAENKEHDMHTQPTAHVTTSTRVIPPLEHGETVTREDFERRYDAMPYLKKAELIGGVVYMPEPVRFDIHGEPHADMMAWLGVYRVATPGVRLGDNATVRLGPRDEVQPDALLIIDSDPEQNSRISEDGYIDGAPELVVEVAGTSGDYDLHEKLEAYRRHGVQEYIVWRTQEKQLDWFRLVEGEYVLLTPDANGCIHSEVFPGLCLAVQALLNRNMVEVLAKLQDALRKRERL